MDDQSVAIYYLSRTKLNDRVFGIAETKYSPALTGYDSCSLMIAKMSQVGGYSQSKILIHIGHYIPVILYTAMMDG